MKRYLPLMLSLLLFSGCSGRITETSAETAPSAQQSSATTPITTAAATAEAVTTTPEPTETSEPIAEIEPALYVDDVGMLTDEGVARISEVVRENLATDSSNYLGLFDFDHDAVPEVYLVRHTGNQGLMPVDVFSLGGNTLGSFEGYCRDGFCRLSYDDNGGVYVHNSYEHSDHLSFESLDRLVFADDGTLIVENIVAEYGYNADPAKFPLLEYHYYSGDTEITMEEYLRAYKSTLWETFPHPEHDWNIELKNREANEISICSPDFGLYDIEDALVKIPLIYNDYINGLKLAEQTIGSEPMVYSYDDFNGDGICEAFVLSRPSGNWYFYSSDELVEAAISDTLGSEDFTRWGEYFIAQGCGNGTPCTIFGVKDSTPYTHKLSGYGMMIRTAPDLGFYRMDNENGIFVLRKSLFDDYSHTWKPYFFHITENGFEEIVGVPVTREDFFDRPDVQAAFDEITNDGGTITGAYERGGYLNINYTIPITETTDSPFVHYRYNTYYIHFDSVTLLEEGRGTYSASITDN